MLPTVIVLVYALAVARVTRLVTADRLTETARERLLSGLWARHYRRHDIPVEVTRHNLDKPLGVYLVTCAWCSSIYVGAVAAPICYWWGTEPWFLVPALALAFSHVTGLLAKIGE